MNLHEYQSKALFAEFGIPVSTGRAATTPESVAAAARQLGGERWVVKAQVHAGARGKAGGIKVAHSPEQAAAHAAAMLGTRLVTRQSAAAGLPVETVYVEPAADIRRELYLGALVDRTRERIVVMVSAAGGVDIEEMAAIAPEKILTAAINPATGVSAYQCRVLGFGLGLDLEQIRQLESIVRRVVTLFCRCDASLVEINPLIVDGGGRVVALDAKIDIEDSALFRQQRLADWRDEAQEDEHERQARAHGLNYVSLGGNIACMVNGAGLAMATMDIIKLHGGDPANFLDVGGATTVENVAHAFKIILANPNVEAILVNIFGGIVRCDLIAEGIAAAVKDIGIAVPVVVRLEGTNAEQGRQLLAVSGLDILPAADLGSAAEEAVRLARGNSS